MTSIYRGSQVRLSDVQVKDAPVNAPARPRLLSSGPDAIALRRASPANTLFAHTVDWIHSLPPECRPFILCRQYARIANQLCVTWNDPASCREYFEDLFLDRRGNRKGFPPDILRELQRLGAYLETIAPDPTRLDYVAGRSAHVVR